MIDKPTTIDKPSRRMIGNAIAALFICLWSLPAASQSGGRLIDQDGQPITEADFAPAYRLVYFGYTHCPDACPVALQVMTDALDRLERLGEPITPVFVSIDPARDTPEVLKRYREMFHPRMKAVTGDADAIAAIAERYKVVYKRVDLGSDRPYTMDHTTSIYLTDKTGRIIGRFLHTLSAGQLAGKIAARLAREP